MNVGFTYVTEYFVSLSPTLLSILNRQGSMRGLYVFILNFES